MMTTARGGGPAVTVGARGRDVVSRAPRAMRGARTSVGGSFAPSGARAGARVPPPARKRGEGEGDGVSGALEGVEELLEAIFGFLGVSREKCIYKIHKKAFQFLIKKIDDSNEVRTPRVVEWSSSQWTCRVPAGSGGAYYQQLFSEWWEFPMPLTRLIRPCHPKNLSVNHL